MYRKNKSIIFQNHKSIYVVISYLEISKLENKYPLYIKYFIIKEHRVKFILPVLINLFHIQTFYLLFNIGSKKFKNFFFKKSFLYRLLI